MGLERLVGVGVGPVLDQPWANGGDPQAKVVLDHVDTQGLAARLVDFQLEEASHSGIIAQLASGSKVDLWNHASVGVGLVRDHAARVFPTGLVSIFLIGEILGQGRAGARDAFVEQGALVRQDAAAQLGVLRALRCHLVQVLAIHVFTPPRLVVLDAVLRMSVFALVAPLAARVREEVLALLREFVIFLLLLLVHVLFGG